MGGFVTALTGENGISASAIWSEISPAAPYVVTLILVKIGYNFVSGLINNTSRVSKKRVVR